MPRMVGASNQLSRQEPSHTQADIIAYPADKVQKFFDTTIPKAFDFEAATQ